MLFDDTDEMTGWERFVAEEAVVKAAADKLVQAIVRDDPKLSACPGVVAVRLRLRAGRWCDKIAGRGRPSPPTPWVSAG